MRAAVQLQVSRGLHNAPGQAGGRSLAPLQPAPRPSTFGRPQARLAAPACSRDQHHGQQLPARWQQADAPPLAAVDRRAAASRQARRWQQRRQQVGQARRPQIAVCSVPAVAAGGGQADHHGEAAGERALHPTALTAL